MRVFLRQKAKELAFESEEPGDIALVAHGGFMHYLTGDWEGAGKYPATGWVNCEMRSYVFEDVGNDGDEHARMVETETSRRGRGVEGRMVTDRVEQRRLYVEAMAAWEGQGLQNHSKIAGEEDGEEDES